VSSTTILRGVAASVLALSVALAVTSCAGEGDPQAAAVAEAIRGAAPEIDAVVVRDASNGFDPVKVYDVYVPELDDENLDSVVDRILAAAAPVVTGDDPVELILYSTAYSEDPIVALGPFNSEPGVLDRLGLDDDGDGDSRDGEGHFRVYPDDLQRVYPS
jgi:hypothetical protein